MNSDAVSTSNPEPDVNFVENPEQEVDSIGNFEPEIFLEEMERDDNSSVEESEAERSPSPETQPRPVFYEEDSTEEVDYGDNEDEVKFDTNKRFWNYTPDEVLQFFRINDMSSYGEVFHENVSSCYDWFPSFYSVVSFFQNIDGSRLLGMSRKSLQQLLSGKLVRAVKVRTLIRKLRLQYREHYRDFISNDQKLLEHLNPK